MSDILLIGAAIAAGSVLMILLMKWLIHVSEARGRFWQGDGGDGGGVGVGVDGTSSGSSAGGGGDCGGDGGGGGCGGGD